MSPGTNVIRWLEGKIVYSVGPERHPPEANAGRVVDRVGDRGQHRLERRFSGAVGRQVGPSRIRITVHQQDVDPFWYVGMAERGMREPVHARHLFGVEPHFFVQSAAQAVKRAAFDGVAKAKRIDDQAAVVRAHQALRPDVTGLPIHLDLRDLRDDGLPAE